MSASTHYEVSAPAGPRCARGRVALRYGQMWPATLEKVDAVVVRFICGYGDEPSSVPGLLKAAMLMDLTALYLDRENVIAEGTKVHSIYWSCRSHETQGRAA